MSKRHETQPFEKIVLPEEVNITPVPKSGFIIGRSAEGRGFGLFGAPPEVAMELRALHEIAQQRKQAQEELPQ